MYIYILIHVSLSLYLSLYIYIYIHMFVHKQIHIYIYIYVCMCVIYIYIYIYIYTHTHVAGLQEKIKTMTRGRSRGISLLQVYLYVWCIHAYIHDYTHIICILTVCVRLSLFASLSPSLCQALLSRRGFPAMKLGVRRTQSMPLGWSNNHFNNLHFRISLETNIQLHVSNTGHCLEGHVEGVVSRFKASRGPDPCPHCPRTGSGGHLGTGPWLMATATTYDNIVML